MARARIRTIKPEFFQHEELYESEKETGLPLRVAYAGLFSIADREGRFEWRPTRIKLAVLPYDDLDFSRVLDALATRGFIVKYEDKNGKLFGHIPTFRKHQVVNAREGQSTLPDPSIDCKIIEVATREARVRHARGTRHDLARGELELEGKGTGRELELDSLRGEISKTKTPSANAGAFIAQYCKSWSARYGTNPLVKGKEAGIARRLVEQFGTERMSELVVTYLAMTDSWFLTKRHDLATFEGNLNAVVQFHDTGGRVTRSQANQQDKVNTAQDQLRRIQEGKL